MVDNAVESTHQLSEDNIVVTYYKLNLIIPVLKQLVIDLDKCFGTVDSCWLQMPSTVARS